MSSVFRNSWIKLPRHLTRGIGSGAGAMVKLNLRPLRLYLALVDAAWEQRSETAIVRNPEVCKLTGIHPTDLDDARAKLVDARLITATATDTRGTTWRYRILAQEEMSKPDEGGSSWTDAGEDREGWARGVS